MSNHSVRITRPFKEIESWITGLHDVTQIVVYEHHDGARIHCHALFKSCLTIVNTLKARLTKLIGKVDKSDWAFPTTYTDKNDNVIPVNDGLITYMHKGTNAPVYIKGFTPDLIKEYEDKWVVTATNPRGSHRKSSKITYADIVDITIAQYKSYTDDIDYTHVPSLVLQNLREKRMVCGRYKTRDIIDTVWCWLNIGEYSNNVRDLAEFKMRQL